ncbi:MAG TPA: C25 family cysteine peptidase [Candidatus Binatia bacterium]|nr:C25 family cysteine peptidase [Candidatus Binatia bacterium]
MGKEWLPIKAGARPNQASVKNVKFSGIAHLQPIAPITQLTRQSTVVSYDVGGVFKASFQHLQTTYDVVTAPKTALSSEEGAPQIPMEGIFVALPNGALNVSVRILDKRTQEVGVFNLRPSPKAITESEYIEGKEEYKKNATIYRSDNDYPGKDFDFFGIKNISGVQVAHIVLYLSQFKPLSRKLSIVEHMEVEISYDIPPQRQPLPQWHTAPSGMRRLILDEAHVRAFPKALVSKAGNFTSFRKRINLTDKEDSTPKAPVTSQPARALTDSGGGGGASVQSKLKLSDNIAQYIIITPAKLEAAVGPLLQAKVDPPYCAKVATTEDIATEFPATSLKQSIKDFLSWAWDNWKAPPHFVILAGDTDTIPTDLVEIDNEQYASDHFFADIKDSYVPEIIVSRLPTSDSTKMKQICKKLAKYTSLRGPDWGNWQNNILLVAHEMDIYKQCSDDVAENIAPCFSVKKKYGDSSTKDDVIDTFNQGVLIANYRGHGLQTAWSSNNGITTQDIALLDNNSMPPMVFCICCENAWIDNPDMETIVETFLRKRKAIAVFGASRDSPTYANNDLDKYLFQAIAKGETTPGGIVQRAKTLMVLNHPNSTQHQADVAMFMLFGDPAAQVVSNFEFLCRTWDINDNCLQGKLDIDSLLNHQIIKDGKQGYSIWDFTGTFNTIDKQYAVAGKVGETNTIQHSSPSEGLGQKIEFKTFINGLEVKDFEGYITEVTKNTIKGFTWPDKKPFHWRGKTA